MKRALRLALALAGVALASALLLEVVVRLLGLAPPIPVAYGHNVLDSHLPYKREPGSVLRGRWHTGEFDYELRHNQLGFRDVEHAAAKPEGVFRIVFLGDSFTYGIGADFEATWPSVVEETLNARPGNHPRVEAVRLGLPRFFPGVERLVLEHYGLALDPDLVLIGVLPNDVVDTHYGAEAIQIDGAGFMRSREARQLGELGGLLYRHSHALRIVLARLAAELSARRDPVRWDDVYRDDGFHEDDWVHMEADLGEIRSLTKQAAVELVVVGIPQRGPWNASHRYPDDRLAAWSERQGAHFVGTLSALEAAGEGEALYWARDGHCTNAGYTAIGRAVAEFLSQRRLVP